MKIVTKAFGELEVSEKQRLRFKEGILGFEDIHEYILIDSVDGGPFYWLQAEKIPEIAFVVIEPSLILPEYKLDADSKDLLELEIEKPEDALLFCIVTVSDDPGDITANLLGPVVINKMSHRAKQIISATDKYSVRHHLIDKKES